MAAGHARISGLKGARELPGFAVVLLAAGGSPGLLTYQGRPLVEHAARTALASGAAEVVVVAGGNDAEIRERLKRLPVRVVRNSEWAEGLSSSIRTGVARLRSDPECVVVALADQPRITPAHLWSLAERVLAGEIEIAASAYEGILGAPAAFSRSVFPKLLALRGEAGARHLIRSAATHVEAISFARANEPAREPEKPRPIFLYVGPPPAFCPAAAWNPRAPPGDLPIAV